MNRCECGGTKVTTEATFAKQARLTTDGSYEDDWIGTNLIGVTCDVCGREVKLDPAMTITLMSHLIECREGSAAS